MRLGLVPVGDRIEVVRAVIGVTMLDGRANRFSESNGRVQMEAIDRLAASGTLLALEWRAKKTIGKGMVAEAIGA